MSVTRTPLHTRNIHINGYRRNDDLWEVEGVLQDTKGYPMSLEDRGLVSVGEYLHKMTLALVFDEQFVIHEVRAMMTNTPYQDCPGAAQQYQALVGLRIQKGWIAEARQALGRTGSCTHLTEMLPALATAALQTIRGYKLNFEPGYAKGPEERNTVRNTCYGFRDGGRAQKQLWPDGEKHNPDTNL